MDLDLDVGRGIDAQQVLQNRIYQEAYSTIEQRLLSELATIEVKPERAEYLRQLIVMGRKYRQYMEQVVVTGKMAQEQRSLLERMKDKVRSYRY